MAKNIVEKGNLDKPLIIYNRTLSVAEEKAKAWGGDSKVVVAKSVDDAVAKADIIFTCLSNDKAITATIEDAVKGNVKGKLFVDNSTVAPETTEKLAKTVEARGGEFVASPGRQTILSPETFFCFTALLLFYVCSPLWPFLLSFGAYSSRFPISLLNLDQALPLMFHVRFEVPLGY